MHLLSKPKFDSTNNIYQAFTSKVDTLKILLASNPIVQPSYFPVNSSFLPTRLRLSYGTSFPDLGKVVSTFCKLWLGVKPKLEQVR